MKTVSLLILLSPLPLLAAEPTRGVYGMLEGGEVKVSAHWPCSPAFRHCDLDLRASQALGGIGVGYSFNKYLSIEGLGHITTEGSNDLTDTYTNQQVTFDYIDVGTAVRVEWPFARHWAAFARVAGVYEFLLANYVPPYEDDTGHTSIQGFAPVLSAGLSVSVPSTGVNVRLAFDHRRVSAHTVAGNSWTLGIDLCCFSRR